MPYPIVALVGYTNAGKSTLFNALTGASVVAQDQLFATLDPTMRGLDMPSGRRAILSDTVGFISDLPTELVEAFRATLEEVAEADVILHVRDVAHPDTTSQRTDVVQVLDGMVKDGLLDETWPQRTIEVLNKADLLGRPGRSAGAGRAASPSAPSRARAWQTCWPPSTHASRRAWRRRNTVCRPATARGSLGCINTAKCWRGTIRRMR